MPLEQVGQPPTLPRLDVPPEPDGLAQGLDLQAVIDALDLPERDVPLLERDEGT